MNIPPNGKTLSKCTRVKDDHTYIFMKHHACPHGVGRTISTGHENGLGEVGVPELVNCKLDVKSKSSDCGQLAVDKKRAAQT